ncbi:hypothetical protein PGTUg99_027963 [Puccinia graminis f. sp. tritici]|uniref:Uncharacterized protein n=1 Tax=Puccinia graminis f. sp. tritici TaxID=56615 RepID=A0A5B0P3M3_PUCGR|nr:hypothetical protein PGTUg99_027963 [Puccinia graminis f. sp. tritici]
MNHSYQQEDPPPKHSTHYHDPNSFQPLYNRHTDPNTERWSKTAGNHQSQQPIPNQSLHARYGQTTANHHPGISQPQFNLSQADRYTAQGVTPVNIQGTAAPTTFPRGPAQGQGLADTDTYPEDRSNTGIHPGPYEARTQSAHLQQAHLPLSQGTPATPLRPDQLTNTPPPCSPSSAR